MSYQDSLRQQAQWVRDAMDPATPDSERIGIHDVDADELEAAADFIDSLEAKIGVILDLLQGLGGEATAIPPSNAQGGDK